MIRLSLLIIQVKIIISIPFFHKQCNVNDLCIMWNMLLKVRVRCILKSTNKQNNLILRPKFGLYKTESAKPFSLYGLHGYKQTSHLIPYLTFLPTSFAYWSDPLLSFINFHTSFVYFSSVSNNISDELRGSKYI